MKTILTILTLIMIISMALAPVKAQSATVEVTPANVEVPDVDVSFNVNVTINNVQDLYAYTFSLYYPNDILNGTSATEGPFLKSGGFTTAFLKINFTDNYNATYGLLNVACTRVGNVTGANGAGTLATVTFKSMATGATQPLDLSDVTLVNSNETSIATSIVDGEVSVLPEFPTALILPIFMALTTMIFAVAKKTKH